jgi:hypothetical protein
VKTEGHRTGDSHWVGLAPRVGAGHKRARGQKIGPGGRERPCRDLSVGPGYPREIRATSVEPCGDRKSAPTGLSSWRVSASCRKLRRRLTWRRDGLPGASVCDPGVKDQINFSPSPGNPPGPHQAISSGPTRGSRVFYYFSSRRRKTGGFLTCFEKEAPRVLHGKFRVIDGEEDTS